MSWEPSGGEGPTGGFPAEPQSTELRQGWRGGRASPILLSSSHQSVSHQGLLLAEPNQKPEGKELWERPPIGASLLGRRKWIWVGPGEKGEELGHMWFLTSRL